MFCKKCGQKIFIIRNEGKDFIFQCSNTQCQEFRKEHRLSMITVLDKTDPTVTENNKNSNSVYASDNVNPDTKCKPFTSTPSDVEAGNTLSPVTPVHQAEHHKYGAQSNNQNDSRPVYDGSNVELDTKACDGRKNGDGINNIDSLDGRTKKMVQYPVIFFITGVICSALLGFLSGFLIAGGGEKKLAKNEYNEDGKYSLDNYASKDKYFNSHNIEGKAAHQLSVRQTPKEDKQMTPDTSTAEKTPKEDKQMTPDTSTAEKTPKENEEIRFDNAEFEKSAENKIHQDDSVIDQESAGRNKGKNEDSDTEKEINKESFNDKKKN